MAKRIDKVNIRGKPEKRSTFPILKNPFWQLRFVSPCCRASDLYTYNNNNNNSNYFWYFHVCLSSNFLLPCFRLLRSEHAILLVLEVGRTSAAGSHPVQTGSSSSRGTPFTMVHLLLYWYFVYDWIFSYRGCLDHVVCDALPSMMLISALLMLDTEFMVDVYFYSFSLSTCFHKTALPLVLFSKLSWWL